MNLRDGFRTIAERSLVASGVPRVRRGGIRDDVLVLAYHNILPPGASPVGDRALHLPFESFVGQLDWLAERYEVLPLEDAIRGRTTSWHRPRVAITFDDAYRGAVTVGVPELTARQLPATIFVAPAFVGGGTFWWDVLARPDGSALDEKLRQHALDELRGEDAKVRHWARVTGHPEQRIPAYARCASEAELHAVAKAPGISLASHTWSHPALARLEPFELHDELARPLAWLTERFDSVVPCLSYPYGSYTASVARAVAAHGYTSALRVGGGWIRNDADDPFVLPRLNVPAGLSLDGFILRTAGLLCR